MRASVAAAAGTIILTLAQFAAPGSPLFHTWEYALVTAFLTGALLVEAWRVRRTWSALALAGAATIGIAGFASGLFGPDTQTIVRAPGTVAPIPDLHLAAFFASAGAESIQSGSASVILRRRDAPDDALSPGARRIAGDAIVMVEPRRAAYVDARSPGGDHLTVTQPTGATFLSPVLLFASTQKIEAVDYPFDTFAVPAAHRVVRAVYFSAAQTAAMQRLPADRRGKAAVLLAVSTDTGAALGIMVSPSGEEVALGGVRLRVVVGTYPALVIASAPYPPLVWLGGFAIVAGCALAGWRSRRTASKRVGAKRAIGWRV